MRRLAAAVSSVVASAYALLSACAAALDARMSAPSSLPPKPRRGGKLPRLLCLLILAALFGIAGWRQELRGNQSAEAPF